MLNKSLVVDIGNTHIKFAFFEVNNCVLKGYGADELTNALQQNTYDNAIIASVASESVTNEITKLIRQPILASNQLKLPIEMEYETPNTLGVDRLANAVAIAFLAKGSPALAVDAGTCLKFDFVDFSGKYLGGSIAPGLRMRFQAMHSFTANLPLVEEWDSKSLIGSSTHGSLVSGALIGMENEIIATIQRYQSQYEDLKIFVTGGDMKYFDLDIKNPIFALENLTLLGLKLMLEENV